jgi:hypothetical protein
MRVSFGSHRDGTVDQFVPLSGIGAGVKLRYSTLVNTETKPKAMEVVGISAGLYYEPHVALQGATSGNSSAQTLSTMLTLSTFHVLYVGLGWKFASSEPSYSHGDGARNLFLVFGVGADGKSL